MPFASRSKAEIATEGLRRGINACVANEPADVLGDPHLKARGFFDTPSGLPERFAAIREGAAIAAPAVHAGDRPGPLSGVKVAGGGEKCTTNAKGRCEITYSARKPGKIKVKATESGFAPAVVKLKVKP